jgi:hypothetical protein
MSLLSLAVLLGGCHRDADRTHTVSDATPAAAPGASLDPLGARDAEPPTVTGRIAWELAAAPSASFPMSKRGEFELWIVARNGGPTVEDTERDALSYEVNGRTSLMLALAFGNGGRDRRWAALPPGQTLREARGGKTDPTFGESLFPTPGEYRLTLRQGDRVVATLGVRVVP